jgi:CheY-like chemotaxis protein/DNA-binding MarR family transcriptional regulator
LDHFELSRETTGAKALTQLPLQPTKVLLVEDDQALAAELVEAVTAAGVDIFSVGSAADAIRLIERQPEFRIVVTDIMLGDISGLELLKKLSKSGAPRRIRSIVLSGYSNLDYVLNALRLGVVDFLPKPIMPEELLDAIRRAVEQDRSSTGSIRELSYGDAAELLLKVRQKRDAIFGPDLFEDPAWNIMLDLYSSTLHGKAVTVSDLCIASGSPATTALRRLGVLVKLGLVERVPDTADRRRVLIAPTEPGRQAMDQFAEWLRKSVTEERTGTT